MIAPVYPLHQELGASWTHWEMLYPPVTEQNGPFDLGALGIRLGRNRSEVFLKILPVPNLYLRTAIQKHDMDFPGVEDKAQGTFQSTDFQETAFLGLGRADRSGTYPHSLKLSLKNLNRVNLLGPVRFSTSNFESRLRLSYGDFRFTDQFFWSDQTNQDMTVFDLVEAGEIDVFTFQDEYFLSYLRSSHFQDAKVEYCPTFGKAGLRLIVGAYRIYEPALFSQQLLVHEAYGIKLPFTPHWEAQAGYATPLGTLRVGLGAIEGGKPFYFVRLGAGLGLGFEGGQ
jgi:hypothetical protein